MGFKLKSKKFNEDELKESTTEDFDEARADFLYLTQEVREEYEFVLLLNDGELEDAYHLDKYFDYRKAQT